jgi:uncharacterized protein YjiS (DUF1127 family)
MFISRLDVDDTAMTAVRSDAARIGADRITARQTVPRRTVLQAIAMTWRVWRHRRIARRELATLDAHILRDIGIPRELVEYEMNQPFWRPLRDWSDVRHTDGR